MPITISYGNPALVGAASFAVGREKGRMKSGAKAADMAQGMLDRRDDKQQSNRDRNDKMRTLGAQMQQKERMQAKGIAQDQDEARMRAEAANARAQQRGNERKEDFDFRQDAQQAGFDQRDREAAARAAADADDRAREQGNLPPSSKYFPPSSGGGGGMPSGGKRTAEWDPYGKSTLPEYYPQPPMALPPNAPRSPAVSEMGGFPQSTQEDAWYLNRDRTDDQTALGQTIAPWVEDPSMKSGGRNGRGYVPQRGFYAQRNYDARQARYAQEQEHRDWLRGMQQDYMNSPAQQRRMSELAGYQDRMNSGQAPHLDQEQQQSANDQMNQEMQQISQNPSGGQMPTRDQQVNDGISSVDINGQAYPIVMGENNVPQVMNGYTPPQQGGGTPQQEGDGSMLQAAPPKGFAEDPYGGQGSGVFSSTDTLDKSAASGLAWSMDKKGYDTNIIEGTGRDKGKYSVQISKKPAEVVKPEKVDSFKPIPVGEWSRNPEEIAKWKTANPKYADWSEEKVAKLRSGALYQEYLKMAQGAVPELEPKPEPEPRSKKFEGGDPNASPDASDVKAELPEYNSWEERNKVDSDGKPFKIDGVTYHWNPENKQFNEGYYDPADPERQQRLKDVMKAKAKKESKDAEDYKLNKQGSAKGDKFKGSDPKASPDASNVKRKTPDQLNKSQAESNRKQGNQATRHNTGQAKKKYGGDAQAFIDDPKTTAKEARKFIEDLMESRR